MNDKDNTQNALNTSTDQRPGDELPASEERAPGYFPAASEVCPRCQAQDYLPVRDADGRDLRECLSCHLIYLPGAHSASASGDRDGKNG